MLNSMTHSAVPHAIPGAYGQSSVDACTGSLRSLIESQIIPRLLEAHPRVGDVNAPNVERDYQPTAAEVTAFAELCMANERTQVLTFIEKLLLDNVNNDSIFLNLIAPAARHLGWLWEQERADFTQVTMGLLQMHQITHRIGYEHPSGPQQAGSSRRVMLAGAPGSQHILGLAMVSEFFRKHGWQVVVDISTTPAELCATVKNEWFDLMGLSVGVTEQLDGLAELIATLKKKSRNRDIPVLLGGPAFLFHTVDARSLGADGIATDALEGVQMASLLVTN